MPFNILLLNKLLNILLQKIDMNAQIYSAFQQAKNSIIWTLFLYSSYYFIA